jgi:solute carrier family 35, member C2
MVKSSVPVWVLLFAILFGLEKPSSKLLGIIGFICLGTFFTIKGEISFSLLGLMMIIGASVLWSDIDCSGTALVAHTNHPSR